MSVHMVSVHDRVFLLPLRVLQEILEGRPYDAKSDLWSLGCVVHELCTLRYVYLLLCVLRIY